jgi:hypothetical protein
MVLRLYGVEGLQQHIRRQVGLAKEFETLLRGDSRFEIVTETSMGLVCFRLKVQSEVALFLSSYSSEGSCCGLWFRILVSFCFPSGKNSAHVSVVLLLQSFLLFKKLLFWNCANTASVGECMQTQYMKRRTVAQQKPKYDCHKFYCDHHRAMPGRQRLFGKLW